MWRKISSLCDGVKKKKRGRREGIVRPGERASERPPPPPPSLALPAASTSFCLHPTNSHASRLLLLLSPSAPPAATASDEDAPTTSAGGDTPPTALPRPSSPPSAPPGSGRARRRRAGPPASTDGDYTTTGRRKRRDTGLERPAARAWDDGEKARFEAAIEQHGRDWTAVAAAVGSRDRRGVASHAQKQFIRWAMEGRRLPPAVEAVGGPGYTISGRVLDPHSASARAYGLRPERVAELLAAGAVLPGVLPPDDPACCVFQPGGQGWVPGAEAAPAARAGAGGRRRATGKAPAGAGASAPAAARPPAPPPPPSRSPTPPPPAPRTEYAASRPKRAAAGPGKASLGATLEALDLLPCRSFSGPPGSSGPLAQPYALSVGRAATAVMDLHAHLCSKEVIGLLGGAWDPEKRALAVAAAFPCKRLAGSLSGTSVELDPAAEVAARAAMAAAGLAPVGWYHSHPIFEPTPSKKDAENQRNYQALFACGSGCGAEPFVGAIVGPYDRTLPSPAAALTWFVVAKGGGGGGACCGSGVAPFSLRHSVGPPAQVEAPASAAGRGRCPTAPPPTSLADDLVSLAKECAAEADAVGLGAAWRGFSELCAGGGGVAGPPLTKAQKAFASLARHLAPGPGVGPLIAALARELGVDGGLAARAAGVVGGAGGAAAGAPAAPARPADSLTAAPLPRAAERIKEKTDLSSGETRGREKVGEKE